MHVSLASLLGLKTATICLLNSTLLLFLFRTATAFNPAAVQVIFAINAGGPEHTDKYGIKYQSDPLNIGIASDYGNNLLMIGRVPQHDEPLYRTERYHTATFGYDFKHAGDGDYALVMKFCEVYFREPHQKIFDIVLNGKHTIVSQLDIFHEVGHGSAHEEVVHFTIDKGHVQYNGEISDVRNGQLRLDFIKGKFDNPKINAFALLKGEVTNIPSLPPLPEEIIDTEINKQRQTPPPQQQQQQQRSSTKRPADTRKNVPPPMDEVGEVYIIDDDDDDEDEEEEDGNDYDRRRDLYEDDNEEEVDEEDDEEEDRRYQKNVPPHKQRNRHKGSRKTSGPRQPDPYIVDDSSMLLPILVAVGAFIPLLFCLCKL